MHERPRGEGGAGVCPISPIIEGTQMGTRQQNEDWLLSNALRMSNCPRGCLDPLERVHWESAASINKTWIQDTVSTFVTAKILVWHVLIEYWLAIPDLSNYPELKLIHLNSQEHYALYCIYFFSLSIGCSCGECVYVHGRVLRHWGHASTTQKLNDPDHLVVTVLSQSLCLSPYLSVALSLSIYPPRWGSVWLFIMPHG